MVLDSHAYQVLGTGAVAEASPDAWAPFAVVTRFSPETNVTLGPRIQPAGTATTVRPS